MGRACSPYGTKEECRDKFDEKAKSKETTSLFLSPKNYLTMFEMHLINMFLSDVRERERRGGGSGHLSNYSDLTMQVLCTYFKCIIPSNFLTTFNIGF
jgi:hypothetical protein